MSKIIRIGKKNTQQKPESKAYEWVFKHDLMSQKITISLYYLQLGSYNKTLFAEEKVSTKLVPEEWVIINVRIKMDKMLKRAEGKWDKYAKLQFYLQKIAEMDGNCRLE